MASRMTRKEAESRRSLYEDGGQAIGELLCRYPEKESQIWKLVAGAGLWTRKDLAAFKLLWKMDNPKKEHVYRQRRYQDRQLLRRRADSLKEKQREASLEAMPTKRKARKGADE